LLPFVAESQVLMHCCAIVVFDDDEVSNDGIKVSFFKHSNGI
jgi:hypothetical protein